MKYTFIIEGETPAKKNSKIITRDKRLLPSKRYHDWHENAYIQVMCQTRPKLPLDCPLSIELTFIHGDFRRRDSDNGTSSIMDLLVDAHVLQDDNWQIVQEIKIQNRYERNQPRCIVAIESIDKGL